MSGTVVRVDKDEVLVDIGYKSEGVIPVSELSIRRSVDPADEVQLGDQVDALVLTKEDAEGRLILSKKRARFEMAWKRIEARGRERRACRGHRDRGRQGRSHPRPRRARFPAGLARRHPPRPGSRRVPGQDPPLQGDRAQPQPEQRRALAPRRPRGGAEGGAPGDPRPALAGRRRHGDDLEHRRLRRVRRPRRDRRPDPHLRALLEPREPSVRGPRHRPGGRGQGARHRPRPAADLPRAQADADRSLAAGRSTPTTRATSSRGASRRWSRSAPSSRSCPASRASCTSPSSPTTTSRTRARSCTQGDTVQAKIIEMDAERRRLSLSLKRVEEAPSCGRQPAADLGLGRSAEPRRRREPSRTGRGGRAGIGRGGRAGGRGGEPERSRRQSRGRGGRAGWSRRQSRSESAEEPPGDNGVPDAIEELELRSPRSRPSDSDEPAESWRARLSTPPAGRCRDHGRDRRREERGCCVPSSGTARR